jgi:DNA-binding transcriptional ArsR family regulator
MAHVGKHPALKQKVRSAIRRRDALDLVGKGLPITEVSQQLSLTPQSVRRHLRAALATESLFPHTLSAERVAELRTIEGEKL